MANYNVDLFQPIKYSVETDDYKINPKTDKDKETIKDLIDRGVITQKIEWKHDFVSYSISNNTPKFHKMLKVMDYYNCRKIYMGELDFLDLEPNIKNTITYDFDVGYKKFTMMGCEVNIIPWMDGILPVRS